MLTTSLGRTTGVQSSGEERICWDARAVSFRLGVLAVNYAPIFGNGRGGTP